MTALGVTCLNVENPESEREYLQSHGASPVGALTGGTARLGGPASPPLLNPLNDLVYHCFHLLVLVRGSP